MIDGCIEFLLLKKARIFRITHNGKIAFYIVESNADEAVYQVFFQNNSYYIDSIHDVMGDGNYPQGNCSRY